MSDPQPDIVLSASKWYLWRRVIAMSVLPLAFSIAFFYDWKIGWPAQRAEWQEWSDYTSGGKEKLQEWMTYAETKGYDAKPEERTEAKIQEQLYWGVGTATIGLGLLVYFLLNYPKKLTADATGFSAPWGPRIPFAEVKRLDRRKWKHKGLAFAFYGGEGGVEKKAVIDDLRFNGAEKVLDRLQANFEGELLDLVEEEEEPEKTAEEAGADKAADSKEASAS